jgi:O-antigen/teichoic acid export membrane protein
MAPGKSDLQSLSTISRTLAKNTIYNLLSQGIYLGLAFWGIPILIHELGPEEFGLLSLIWAVIGYFTLLDFGISRANTKFLAEVLVKKDRVQEHRIIWTSIISTAIIGILSFILIFSLTPYVVENVLKVNVALRSDAIKYFTLTSLSIPFMLVYGTLKGFQMAIQRFDQINIFQISIGIVQWLGSILLLKFHYGLFEIVCLTVISRIVFTVVVAFSMAKIYPGFYSNIQFINMEVLKKLWGFGGWVTLSQIISPLYLYLDRIFIGMFLTLNAVAYYSIPQETLMRLLILTMSFTTTLFPAMSVQSVVDEKLSYARTLYSRSLKYLLIFSLPVTVCFFLFTKLIISVWLGEQFAEKTLIVFQILSVGLLLNSIAQIPNTVLHAFNRPDIPAKFHLLELPLMVGLNLVLIPLLGIAGAAIVWSGRVILDAILHLMAVEHLFKKLSLQNNNGQKNNGLIFISIASVVITFMLYFIPDIELRAFFTVLLIGVYFVSTWQYSFDEFDRNYFLQLKQRIFIRI